MEKRAYEDAVAIARDAIAVVRRYNDARSMAVWYLAEGAKGEMTFSKDDIDMLTRVALAHKRQPGTDRFAYTIRDLVIVGTILAIEKEFGLKPTRNEATDGVCACSVVAEACKQLRVRLSESALEKIWEHRRSTFDQLAKDPFLTWMATWWIEHDSHLMDGFADWVRGKGGVPPPMRT
jgi:hypothetical protein